MVASAQALDVSSYQGAFDWANAKAMVPSLVLGIYKVTEGTSWVDPQAQHNHDGLKAAGLAHGAYHFLRPGDSGSVQAQFFVSRHQLVGLDSQDILALDNETLDGFTAAHVAGVAQDFMAALESLCPKNPKIVYSNFHTIGAGACDGLGHYPLWLAFPAGTAPAAPLPWANWTFWQWGQRNGVDADAFNGTVDDFQVWLAAETGGGTWQEWLTLGGHSLEWIAAQCGMKPSVMLVATAKHYVGFGAVLGHYVNEAFTGAVSFRHPIPAGARLWVKR